ncbi:hypothetical protein BH11PSE11_BH11PSE11_27130 [soil metagenome]
MSKRSNSKAVHHPARKAALSRASLSALVALSASLAGPVHSANTAVPWLNQPAPDAAQSDAAPAQRPCAESDLQITAGAKGAYRGQATQEIRLSNRGADKCFLNGFPSTQLLPTGQAPQSLAAHDRAPQVARDRLELEPGQDAVVLIGTPGSCDAAIGPQRKVNTRLQLALPGGGSKVLNGVHVDTLCGNASVLRFDAVHNDTSPSAKAAKDKSPFGQLSGTVTAPEIVGRGATLRYSVTLYNAGTAAISFASCPSYTQSLYVDGKVTANTMRLNCGATGSQIAANSSATYEMQLAVPADLPAGDAKLSWQLQNGPLVGMTAVLR